MVRTTVPPTRITAVTAAARVSVKPTTLRSRCRSPLGEMVTGFAVANPMVRSTVILTPLRAMLPASSRRSTLKR